MASSARAWQGARRHGSHEKGRGKGPPVTQMEAPEAELQENTSEPNLESAIAATEVATEMAPDPLLADDPWRPPAGPGDDYQDSRLNQWDADERQWWQRADHSWRPYPDDGGGRGEWVWSARQWEASWDGSGSQTWDERHSWPGDGILNTKQLREFHTAEVPKMTGFADHLSPSRRMSWTTPTWEGSWESQSRERPTEKVAVPEFEGAGADEGEIGKGARSYVRKVQVWLRCTRLPPEQRALALYNALAGRAWIYAEELDMDTLASPAGVTYFLEWIQTRFAEVELHKIAQVMSDLFRRFRRRSDQTIRDYIVEFERLVLRLHEVQCELPDTVKAWLFVDKLRLSEGEELALLASVNNQWSLKALQQAALVQERSLRRSAVDTTKPAWKGGGGRWQKNSVHMTDFADEAEGQDESEDQEGGESDADIVPEDVAQEHHTAYVAYQAAKDRYKEALRGRGTDPGEVKRRSEERLKLAKSRSYCSACKRKGHWHKDAECPLRGKHQDGRSVPGGSPSVSQSAHECHVVHATYHMNDQAKESQIPDNLVYAVENATEGSQEAIVDEGELVVREIYMASAGVESAPQPPPMLAIIDTACTKTVAGHDWYEAYFDLALSLGFEPEIVEEVDLFRFGASRTHRSCFSVRAWFAIEGCMFQTSVAVVQCNVPLLFSRPVLSALGLLCDVAGQKVSFTELQLEGLPLATSATGHPAVVVTSFRGQKPPACSAGDNLVTIPVREAYMVRADGEVEVEAVPVGGAPKSLIYPKEVSPRVKVTRPLFYPKKVSLEVQAMLEEDWGSGGQAFLAWWRVADQSRDYWIETPQEMIRVHMVPRKGLFSPEKWSTNNIQLKSALLDMLGSERVSECMPCLQDVGVLQRIVGKWAVQASPEPELPFGLWVGRSRFAKKHSEQGDKPAKFEHSQPHGLQPPLSMEDAQGGPLGRAPRLRGGMPREVGGAGTSGAGERAAQGESRAQGGGTAEGDYEVVAGRADSQGQGREHRGAGQADEGGDDCVASFVDAGAGRPADDLRQVQGLDVSGHAGRLSQVGPTRGGGQLEPSPRPGALRFMGRVCGQEDGRSLEGEAARPHQGLAGGPGGEREDPSAGRDSAQGGRFGELGRILGYGARCCAEVFATTSASRTGGEQQRGGGCAGGGPEGDCRDRGEVGGAQAEAPDCAGTWAVSFAGGNRGIGRAIYITSGINETVDSDDDVDCDGEGLTYETKECGVTEGETTGENEDGETTKPFETLEYKEVHKRAAAGIRRRKWEKAGASKKLRASGVAILQAFSVCCAAAVAGAVDLVAAPAKDAWAVLQGQHPAMPGDEDRADFLELFAGRARLSAACARKHCSVLEPIDLRYGHDLRDGQVQDDVLRKIAEHKPRLVWASSPRGLTLRGRRGAGCVPRRLSSFAFLAGCLTCSATLEARSRSRTADALTIPQRWIRQPDVEFVEANVCSSGLRSGKTDQPLLKGISVLTNSQAIRSAVDRRCRGLRDCTHAHGLGATLLAVHPEEFARAVAEGVARRATVGRQEALVTQGALDENPIDVVGADSITFKGKVNPAVASLIKRVHQNLGHPPNRELIRHLKIGGASEAMIHAAGQLVCKTCNRCSKAKLPRVARPVTALDFNEVVAIDVIWLEAADSAGADSIPSLQPGQLIEILKGVFGLSTSPKLWWLKMSEDLCSMVIEGPDEEIFVKQNTMDPCVFQLIGVTSGRVRGLLLTHVDDILLLTEDCLKDRVQRRIKELFPLDEWEDDCFEYVGCEYVCTPEKITIRQKGYTEGRVDKVTINKDLADDDLASPEQIEENRTAIGSVSWLAKMSRPDLQFLVSQAQRRQNHPTGRDLKETNKLVDAAKAGGDKGITLYKVEEEKMVFLAYHDAAWGNVHMPDAVEADFAWNGEHTLASQLGSLVVVCDKDCLAGRPGPFGVIEWKSKASHW